MSDAVLVALISLAGTIITVLASNAKQRQKTKEDIQEQVGNLEKKVDKIEKKFDAHIKSDEEAEQKNRRFKMLRFSNELQEGKNWSKEYFDDILESIDEYDKYCDEHPEFHNNKGKLAKAFIKSEYERRFLKGEKYVTE